MIRLAVAALLALGIHATGFWIQIPWSQPTLMVRQSKAVSIDLVTLQKQKPVEKPVPPRPEIVQQRPKPKTVQPRPKPKPAIKPVVQPPPVASRPIPQEPLPEPAAAAEPFDANIAPEEALFEPDAAEEISPAEAQAQPAVQASVPRYDINPPPHYPRVARRRNYQGSVMLDVRVTVDGQVAEVQIAESSGHAILDQSAVKSVKGWQFTPAKRGDQPIEMWVQVPVRYELK